ncbi:hypothetical protein DJ68_03025 [Halorubrum sp. C3]|nr:hypothetical protein DJ68_03025 [Halorubrum sp. C3]
MLTERAILTVSAFDRTGVFELKGDYEPTRELTHSYLVGGSGQALGELYSQSSDLDPTGILPDADFDRRAGFFLDAGAGRDAFTLTATVGVGDEDLRWGDGSSAAGEVTAYDAAGDVSPTTKRDVLYQWLREGRSDSGGQLQLHIGEWTDGSYSNEAGVFGEPIPVALISVRAERVPDDSTVVTYTFEFERVAEVPNTVDETIDDFTDAAGDAVDELGGLIPEF